MELVGFVVVNTVLCLPDGQVKVFGKVLVEIQITDTEVVSVRNQIIQQLLLYNLVYSKLISC